MARARATRPRKRPSQARSRFTVDAILEAAARVFEERGYAGGTTNHIAARAGVSVGSLYEYFPNKDAIVVALAERELEREREVVLGLLASTPAREPLARTLRRFVEAIVRFHEQRPALHRILFDEAMHPPEAHGCVLRFEEAAAHALERILCEHRVRVADPDVAAHLMVQTTESLAHRYVLRGIHDLDREGFVGEVARLLARYAGVREPAPATGRSTRTG